MQNSKYQISKCIKNRKKALKKYKKELNFKAKYTVRLDDALIQKDGLMMLRIEICLKEIMFSIITLALLVSGLNIVGSISCLLLVFDLTESKMAIEKKRFNKKYPDVRKLSILELKEKVITIEKECENLSVKITRCKSQLKIFKAYWKDIKNEEDEDRQSNDSSKREQLMDQKMNEYFAYMEHGKKVEIKQKKLAK